MAILTQLQPKLFLDSVLAMFAESASKKSITLAVQIQDGLPDVFYCDKSKLTQIMMTLSDHAIRRTEKGSVTIHLKTVDIAVQGKQFIEFCVEDTGCGLDTDSIEQLLDTDIPVANWPQEFSNNDSAMALRMAAKLVEILGGKLQVSCGNAVATTRFFFTIAVKLEENKTADQTPPPVLAKTNGIRILIVDDVPENRMLLEALLKKMGHQIQLATNGQEAVESCKKEQFDVILMDIRMPVLDGFEAARRIRTDSVNTQSTIIAMTASGDKSDDFAALDAGCDDCLSKPIEQVKLERKLSRIVARLKQMRDAEQGGAIVSFLEGDSDYQKAVETFIESLPARVAEIKAAYEKGDTKDLVFKIHALKGVGGFAGFPVFTEKAKRMEQSIKTCELDKLQFQVDELVDLCLRTKRKDQAQL